MLPGQSSGQRARRTVLALGGCCRRARLAWEQQSSLGQGSQSCLTETRLCLDQPVVAGDHGHGDKQDKEGTFTAVCYPPTPRTAMCPRCPRCSRDVQLPGAHIRAARAAAPAFPWPLLMESGKGKRSLGPGTSWNCPD